MRVLVDVVIFGGGAAGLWCMAALRGAGYACVLLEREALGAGQTIASQGIIHGGVKYAIGGATSASKAIAEMPGLWRSCLRGEAGGPAGVDLRGARILSEAQHLWTSGGLVSRVAGALASRSLRTAGRRIEPEEAGGALAGASDKATIYCVDEPVLDPGSLLRVLGEQAGALAPDAQGAALARRVSFPDSVRLSSGRAGEPGVAEIAIACGDGAWVELAPRVCIFAAGEGNEDLIAAAGLSSGWTGAAMQRRPLHMVMARGRDAGDGGLPELFGHCVGGGATPRLTVTSQTDSHGRRVWYIGGGVAESGVERSAGEQLAFAKREVSACLPWIDLSCVEWTAMRINRAEGVTAGGSRPDEPVVRRAGSAVVVWPTKLALAPRAAERVLDEVRAVCAPGETEEDGLLGAIAPLPLVGVAALPWEREGVAWR